MTFQLYLWRQLTLLMFLYVGVGRGEFVIAGSMSGNAGIIFRAANELDTKTIYLHNNSSRIVLNELRYDVSGPGSYSKMSLTIQLPVPIQNSLAISSSLTAAVIDCKYHQLNVGMSNWIPRRRVSGNYRGQVTSTLGLDDVSSYGDFNLYRTWSEALERMSCGGDASNVEAVYDLSMLVCRLGGSDRNACEAVNRQLKKAIERYSQSMVAAERRMVVNMSVMNRRIDSLETRQSEVISSALANNDHVNRQLQDLLLKVTQCHTMTSQFIQHQQQQQQQQQQQRRHSQQHIQPQQQQQSQQHNPKQSSSDCTALRSTMTQPHLNRITCSMCQKAQYNNSCYQNDLDQYLKSLRIHREHNIANAMYLIKLEQRDSGGVSSQETVIVSQAESQLSTLLQNGEIIGYRILNMNCGYMCAVHGNDSVYMADPESGWVALLDRSLQIVGYLPTKLQKPRGMIWHRDQLYVAESDQSNIAVISNHRVVNNISVNVRDITDLVYLPKSNQLLIGGLSGIYRVHIRSGRAKKPFYGMHLKRPQQMYLDEDAQLLWVADEDLGRVQVIDPFSGRLVSSFDVSAHAQHPTGVLMDSQCRLYVSDKRQGKLYVFNPVLSNML